LGFAEAESNGNSVKPGWMAYYRANLEDSAFKALIAKADQLKLEIPSSAMPVIDHFCKDHKNVEAKEWAGKILNQTEKPDAQWIIGAYILGQNEFPPQDLEQVMKRYGYSFYKRDDLQGLDYDMNLIALASNIAQIVEATYPRIDLPSDSIEYLKSILDDSQNKKEIEELGVRLRSEIEALPFDNPGDNARFYYEVLGYLNTTGDSQFLSDLWSHPGKVQRKIALEMGAYAADQIIVQTMLDHIQKWYHEDPEGFFEFKGMLVFFIREQIDSPGIREMVLDWILPQGTSGDAQGFHQMLLATLGLKEWSYNEQHYNLDFLENYIDFY